MDSLRSMSINFVTSRIKAIEDAFRQRSYSKHHPHLRSSMDNITSQNHNRSILRSIGRRSKKFLKSSRFSGIPFAVLYGLFFYAYINYMILPGQNNGENSVKKPTLNITISCSRLSSTEQNKTSVNNETTVYQTPTNIDEEKRHIFTSVSIAFSLSVVFGVMSLFSKHVRCIMVLVLPGLITGRGRAILMTLVIGMLVDGPVNSINHNINEVVESNACMYESMKGMACSYATQVEKTIEQAFKMIHWQHERMLADLKAVSEQMKEFTGSVVKELAVHKQKIEKRLKQLDKEIITLKGFTENFRSPCEWADSTLGSVEGFFSDTGKTISAWFGGKRRRKRSTMNCNAAIPFPNIPDFNEQLDLESLKELQEWMKDLFPDVDLTNLKSPDLDRLLDVPNVARIREKIVKTVSDVFQTAKEYLESAKRFFLIVSMLLLILLSYRYLQNYYSDDSFDNQFIDNNIRDLWHKRGYEKLTPLRHWELNARYQVSASPRLTKQELKRILLMMLPTSILCMTVIIVMLCDYALAKLLANLAVNGKFALSFQGMEQEITLKESLQASNNSTHEFLLKLDKVDLSTDPCLPRPAFTDKKEIIVISVLVVVMAFSCFFDAYFSRVRAQICNLFYKERSIERAEYLYERLKSGRNIRRLRFHMILSKEMNRRRKMDEFAWLQYILKTKWQQKHKQKNIVCPGCGWKIKLLETVNKRINEKDTLICNDCAKDM